MVAARRAGRVSSTLALKRTDSTSNQATSTAHSDLLPLLLPDPTVQSIPPSGRSHRTQCRPDSSRSRTMEPVVFTDATSPTTRSSPRGPKTFPGYRLPSTIHPNPQEVRANSPNSRYVASPVLTHSPTPSPSLMWEKLSTSLESRRPYSLDDTTATKALIAARLSKSASASPLRLLHSPRLPVRKRNETVHLLSRVFVAMEVIRVSRLLASLSKHHLPTLHPPTLRVKPFKQLLSLHSPKLRFLPRSLAQQRPPRYQRSLPQRTSKTNERRCFL